MVTMANAGKKLAADRGDVRRFIERAVTASDFLVDNAH